jgi:hypothetical protein
MEEVEESQRGEHRLRILRQDYGLSQKATEEEANINSDTLGNYAPHGQAISTIYPYINNIREYYMVHEHTKAGCVP